MVSQHAGPHGPAKRRSDRAPRGLRGKSRHRREVYSVRTSSPATVPAGARTLEGHWYRSEDVFRRERELIFSQAWRCVDRVERLSRAGEYLLAEVDGESVIVLRDARGKLRAFYNVCRHRGTRLCTAPAG